LKSHLQKVQESYKTSSNEFQKKSSTFQVRDRVWLFWQNIKTNWSCNKLGNWRLWPFSIDKQINLVAYQLEFLLFMKVHLVFHVSLLKVYKESNNLGRTQQLPPCVEIKNHIKYEVKKILNLRQRWNKLKFLIHWRGYDINECNWKLAKNLINAL